MIERQTVVDRIEIDRAGNVMIRFGLLLVEDGVTIDCKWHRTAVEPGGDVDAQIAAVNDHLRQMGRATVAVKEVARVRSVAAAVHTPAVVAEHRQRAGEQA